MTLRQYLILMTVGTVVCWITWLFVVYSLNPFQAGFVAFAFFYFSSFLALVGTFSVIGFIVRSRIIQNDEVVFRHVKKTFRQSIIVAGLVLFALLLLQLRLLRWWNSLLLLLLFILCEGLIFSNRKYNNADYV